MVLIGYIPITKLECYTDSTRSVASWRLWHFCMSRLLEPLVNAGKNGVEMTCADGYVRRIFPLLAAYIADYPEQLLVCCCQKNTCARCKVPPDMLGDRVVCQPRDPDETLQALRDRQADRPSLIFDAERLRPVDEPFWGALPQCDIFSCIMPDILHQLHKGVFKDHLLTWCTTLIGEDEADRRFRAMTDFPGLRHFRNGISHVSQWTGREHKEMQRIIVGLLAGAVPTDVMLVVRALVDFIYYAQLQSHTDTTLAHLQPSLDAFHKHKDVFVRLGIREHFNIPKLHFMLHYVEAIRSRGSCDGFNTELPERLHIDYAKQAYRASNRRNYLEQMVTWLARQEAIDLHASYVHWYHQRNERKQPDSELIDEDWVDEPDSAEDGSEQVEVSAQSDECMGHGVTSGSSYSLAKQCPFPGIPLDRLERDYGATEFLPALTAFIRSNLPACQLKPNRMDRYDVYKNIRLTYRAPPHGDTRWLHDRIRTVLGRSSRGRKPAIAAHFDTAFVQDPDAPIDEDPRSVSGEYSNHSYCLQSELTCGITKEHA